MPTDNAAYTITVVINNAGGCWYTKQQLTLMVRHKQLSGQVDLHQDMSDPICVVSLSFIAFNTGTTGQYTVLGSGGNFG